MHIIGTMKATLRLAVMLLPALVLMATVVTTHAQKQSKEQQRAEAPIIRTGNWLWGFCQHYKKEKYDSKLGVGCAFYVMGTAQTLLFNETTAVLPPPCPGKYVDDEQITDVVVKWLEDHPDKRDVPAPGIVAKAMNEAFPCK